MTGVLVLGRGDMERLLPLAAVIPVVEKAFVAFADGRTLAYPVVREEVPAHRGIFGIKSGYLRDEEVIGLKAGGFWLGNPARGHMAHQSSVLLFDPRTGLPTAFLDGTHITTVRTAAVGALAARRLARTDARVAASIGCGVQGTGQALALLETLPIAEVRAYDAVPASAERFAETLRARGVAVRIAAGAEDAVGGADVVVTATPGKAAVLKADWVRPGMHVSAFGADTRGKIEVEPELFARATVVVDDVTQATTIGETQHAIARGLLRPDQIATTLGEILAGRHPGRTRPDEITLFDATGLAFQDLVCADLAVRLAAERGLGTRVDIG
jgi:ornithine cyclodeaminase